MNLTFKSGRAPPGLNIIKLRDIEPKTSKATHLTLTPRLAERLMMDAPADLWGAQLFPLLGSDDWDARDVAHYTRMCRMFRNALLRVRHHSSGLVVARIPRINVPSTWAPSIYDALDTFQHHFVSSKAAAAAAAPNSDAPVFEIRLAPGVFPIDRNPRNILKGQPDWTGIDLRGPEFSGLSICGAGPDKTTLSKGKILVGKTTDGQQRKSEVVAPLHLEGFAMDVPRLASRNFCASLLSVSYKGFVRVTSCSFSNDRFGVYADGFNTHVQLVDCICAHNLDSGVYVSKGALVEISGASSRVVGNGLHSMSVENGDGVIRIIDLGDDEATSPLFQGPPNRLRRDGYRQFGSAVDFSLCDHHYEKRVYYMNDGVCAAEQRAAAAARLAADLGAEATEVMGNLFGDDDEGDDY